MNSVTSVSHFSLGFSAQNWRFSTFFVRYCGSEARVLWLRLPSAAHPALDHINRVIAMFPGDTPARLVFSDTGKRMGTTCLLGTDLVEELSRGLGAENVVIQ